MKIVSFEEFVKACDGKLNIKINPNTNFGQYEAISARPDENLFIVAGPGTGKTTVLTLKVLKFIFVDGISPDEIMITTFTRKAAKEIRSRILGWGEGLRQYFLFKIDNDPKKWDYLRQLDFNQIITGTLDSIVEEKLGEYREPGTQLPVVVEDFASTAIMIREGLLKTNLYRDNDLTEFLAQLAGTKYEVREIARRAEILKQIRERLYHDQVDIDRYKRGISNAGALKAIQAIEKYEEYLSTHLLYDYVDIEQNFLEKLKNGKLEKFVKNLKILLVDEYQDTNLLQESIYFEIARYCIQNGGSITVVGDDDQSIFRFRGATVEIFSDYPTRVQRALGITPKKVFLNTNYRSTEVIVELINDFITLDSKFQEVRVSQKPQLNASRKAEGYPIIGIFRENVNELATDLAEFIYKVLTTGYKLSDGRVIKVDPNYGGPGDIAVLFDSPREFRGKRARLPLLLRRELEERGIKVFNPRGIPLTFVDSVQILLGLTLECIDPNGNIQSMIHAPRGILNTFDMWRETARRYIERNPHPTSPINLEEFVKRWQNRQPYPENKEWSKKVPLKDLIYKLTTWIPKLVNDVEGVAYLEAIVRAIDQAALFTSYSTSIIFEDSASEQTSIKELYWYVFVPIAGGAIEIDEELLETLPKDRVNFMSIHQAKGLEFPVTIVDIGSDFRKNHPLQRRYRYPDSPELPHRLEDELRPYSPLGTPSRSGVDRAFDDLYRKFYVAFSRAQDVLVLVGLNRTLTGNIPNVAAGWDREGMWITSHKWGFRFNKLKEKLGGNLELIINIPGVVKWGYRIENRNT